MISFCIVNFNTKTTTHETIASISRSLSGKDYEIVLADNASTDGSREYFTELKKTFANLKYVYNESNVGFGRANNIAASLSQGEILVIINPDIEVRQKGFDQFVKAKLSAEVGVLSPGLFYPDGSIQPNCGGFSTIWTYIFQSIRAGYIVRKLGITRIMSALSKSFPPLKQTIIGKYLQNFDEASCGLAKECDWVSGACMIIRKHVFNEVKGFDENFFMYVEDEDLCRRIRSAGFKIIHDSSFSIIHQEGYAKDRGSSRLTSTQRERVKSSIYYIYKYYGAMNSIFLKTYFMAFYVLSSFLQLLVLNLNGVKDRLLFVKELYSLNTSYENQPCNR